MKQNRMYKVLFCLVVFASINGFVFGQNNFAFKANLDSVLQSGFYNISLSPAIAAKCKDEFEDIRITDANNQEAPYILYTESARPNEDAFTEFPLSYSEDRKTIYLNNILPNSLDKLFLLIKNSEAQRIATLSGSDDNLHWFVIKEDIVLQNEFTADKDAFVQSVSFPKSSYKYFRITMPGKNVLPLNIIKAGVYRSSFTNSVYDTIPSPRILQKDSSDKRSYIYLLFSDSYQTDRLILSFSGIKYYKRLIAVYDKNTINTWLVKDSISSVKQADVDFHAKTNRLLLVVENGDNVPLSLSKVTALKLHTSVTAYLEKSRIYTMYFGDSNAVAPSYDLQYFNDSIGNNILPLAVKSIAAISKIPSDKNEHSDGNKWVLWSIIIAVLLLLIYFSFRMMRDIKNKTNNDVHL